MGWYNRKLLAVSLNGYVSFFKDLITYSNRAAGDSLQGLETEKSREQIPESQRPDGNKGFQQKENNVDLTTYGGEIELRLFPIKGLMLVGGFGIYLGEDNQGKSLQYAANWQGSLRLAYRFRFVRFSIGSLFVGPKRIPATSFSMPNAFLPLQDTNQGKSVPVPSWEAEADPSISVPFYVHTFASLQFLKILGHMDLVFRLRNFLNINMYDASDILLMPHSKLDFMAWLRLHY